MTEVVYLLPENVSSALTALAALIAADECEVEVQ